MDTVKYKFSLGGSLTPVVKILLIINTAAFVFLNLARNVDDVILFLGLVPGIALKERYLWQFLTYMFIHTDFIHLFFNMFALWLFGSQVENVFGKRRFIFYYFFTGIGAGLSVVLLDWKALVPTIGASGAIFGILLAYAVMFPNRVVYLWFVVPVKAKWLVLGYAVLEFLALFRTGGSTISHSAHLGGIAFGLLWFFYYLKLYRSLGKLFKKRRPRIRIVGENEDILEDFFKNDKNGTVH